MAAAEGDSAPRRRSRTLTPTADAAAPARKPRSKAAAVELPETPKRHRAKVGEAILSEDTGKKPRARKAAGKPTTPTPAEQIEQLKQTVLGALEDLKARELLVLDTRPLTSMFDWRIIVTGTSNRHLSSMAEEVAKRAKAIGMPPMYISGDRESDWVLVDLGDIIVDLMSEQSRAHYALEKLWSVPTPPPAA
jgi:ribosome-associated protein